MNRNKDDQDAKEGPAEPSGEREGTRRHRKERVLHTRVPAVLEQELKRLAGALSVPVSNVVRIILQDAVQTLDSVGELAEGELRGVADRLGQTRERLRRQGPGWATESPAAAPDGAAPAGPDDTRAGASTAEPDGGGNTANEERVAVSAERHSALAEPPPLAGVLGYQPMLLARAERCVLCGRPLAAGEQAYLGIRAATAGAPVILGQECLPLSVAERPNPTTP